jgi:hypothetical protein
MHYGMKISGTEFIAPPFFTSALDEADGSAYRPGRITPELRVPGIHWIKGCVCHRASLDAIE